MFRMPEFTGISEGNRRLVFKRDFTEASFLVKLQERTGGAKSKMMEARKGSEKRKRETVKGNRKKDRGYKTYIAP